MKAFMKIMLKDKGKEKEGESSRAEENSRDVSTARVGESKGMLPTPAVSLKDQGNSKDPLNTYTLPKIELLTFEGKEPRVWLRKCTKYFDDIRSLWIRGSELPACFLLIRLMRGFITGIGERSTVGRNLKGIYAIDLGMMV